MPSTPKLMSISFIKKQQFFNNFSERPSYRYNISPWLLNASPDAYKTIADENRHRRERGREEKEYRNYCCSGKITPSTTLCRKPCCMSDFIHTNGKKSQ